MKQRWAACVEYKGPSWHGFQRQSNSKTVQGELEKAIGFVANEDISIAPSGRTDAQVHAVRQIIHFDSIAERKDYQWLRGINGMLPPSIKLTHIYRVPDEFHARYSALSREYQYIILNRTYESTFWSDAALWYPAELDVSSLEHTLQILQGKHDFSAFRSSSCQAKHPYRTLLETEVTKKGNLVIIRLKADGFLQNMVRIIVGTLLDYHADYQGCHTEMKIKMKQTLESKSRGNAGRTARGHGLFFMGPTYPECYNLPNPSSVDALIEAI